MKNVARRVFRPFSSLAKALARPFVSRLHARVVFWAHEVTDERFENLEHQVGPLRKDIAGLERYVPAVLSAIASQNAMNRANVRSEAEIAALVHAVLERFDEALSELRGSGDRLAPFVEAKVLRPERLERLPRPWLLNLASGRSPLPTHVNVDVQPFDEVDVLADLRHLPFDAGSVAEIRAVHLLERYSVRELEEVLLPHWVSLLRPGATVVVTVTDAESMIRRYVAGELDFDALRDATFGEGGAAPLTIFSRDSATAMLVKAGLEEPVVRQVGWPTGTDTLEVSARKPVGAAAA